MSNHLDITVLQNLLKQVLLRVSDLEEENEKLRTENEALSAQNKILWAQNEELHTRLNKNSTNSHRPPGSDGMRKKTALPRGKNVNNGGQPGHKGNTLKAVATPDIIELHHAPACSCCQKVFEAADVKRISKTRQVFDIPQPRMQVTEHRLGVIECCGITHEGTFPLEAAAAVQYGHRLKALVTLLNVQYRMPLEQIQDLMDDLFDCPINESSIIAATEKCAEVLQEVEADLKAAILQSPVAHFDETGTRCAGKLHWVHVACTYLVTYLYVHPKRGGEAFTTPASVFKDYTGYAVHDCWHSYFSHNPSTHILCNAHILRELHALNEKGREWSQQMSALIMRLYQQSKTQPLDASQKATIEAEYDQICAHADSLEPPPVKSPRGKAKSTPGRNLLNRLRTYRQAIITFAFDPSVPFTNNQAERDIRNVKVKQKVAGAFRTLNGAQIYARIQSFVSTTRKQKQNTFQQLCRLLNGHTYVFNVRG